MAKEDIAIVGLPSAGLQKLVGAFDIRLLEDTGIRRAYDKLAEFEDSTPAWMVGGMAGGLHQEAPRNLLAVYQTPWEFLERLVTRAARLPGTAAQLASLSANALELWHAYHAALLALRHSQDKHCVLVNGDRAIDLGVLARLMRDRLGLRAVATPEVQDTHVAGANEQAYCQIVDMLVPQCLELYAGLESSADLMGREPEFEFGNSADHDAQAARMLALAAQLSRIGNVFARHGIDPRELEEQLDGLLKGRQDAGASDRLLAVQEKLKSMQNEAGLYLHQIHNLQDELDASLAERRKLEAELKALSEARTAA